VLTVKVLTLAVTGRVNRLKGVVEGPPIEDRFKFIVSPNEYPVPPSTTSMTLKTPEALVLNCTLSPLPVAEVGVKTGVLADGLRPVTGETGPRLPTEVWVK
jgi:hypothetical protein